MHILLYGGCHALVLRDLIDKVFAGSGIEISLVINFQLIASGRDFPYDVLDRCDALVFSPIENKGEYNTDRLLAHCEGRSIKTLCFPWMEWHGYCPGATKGIFKGRFQWYYPKLLEMAESHTSFDSFVDDAMAHFPDDETIDTGFARSTSHLAASERRHDMQVRISDFIVANHRRSRLFLISDHPSLSLYLHTLGQIADRLGLRMPDTGDLELALPEPQWRWRTPIFPRVEDRLGLEFDDRRWVDDELIAGRCFDLETYLRLYFHRDSVIIGPSEATRIELPGVAADWGETDAWRAVDPSARISASRLDEQDAAGRAAYLCHEALAGGPMVLGANERFRIDPDQWRSTWQF